MTTVVELGRRNLATRNDSVSRCVSYSTTRNLRCVTRTQRGGRVVERNHPSSSFLSFWHRSGEERCYGGRQRGGEEYAVMRRGRQDGEPSIGHSGTVPSGVGLAAAE